MFTTGEIVGLAELIIDDTCLVERTFPNPVSRFDLSLKFSIRRKCIQNHSDISFE